MLEPRYDHKSVEEKIYKLWEKSGYFNPDRLPPINAELRRFTPTPKFGVGASADQRGEGQRKSASSPRKSAFTIIMPPPNANGSLHIGHAVFVTLQDIMIRFARMRGKKALWLPGADHAGFETWVVFDKKLEKEGRNKYEIGRRELFEEIWDFTQKNKKVMEGQLRRLGASCDWSREKFTLDPDIVETVCDTFEKLYKDGLVYRGERIVNWCAKHQTSLSDIESRFREQEDPLYYLKYGPFTIATARPETKFGDKYVVAHPDDERYKDYEDGQKIDLEWINGPVAATVIKDKAIDMAFGTGAMTITPWHDPIDFEIAERHKLDKEQIIDFRGKLLPVAGEFADLNANKARSLIIEKLSAKGLIEKIEPNYTHSVRVCYKCGNPIEPQIKSQWFIRMTEKPHTQNQNLKSLRDLGIEAAKKIKFFPESSKKTYLRWLENIRDWNISRQIVWGIRIPAWFCVACGAWRVRPKVKSKWFLVRHGETVWNKEKRTQGHMDVPLTETGKLQAHKAAETLRSEKIDLIISSDLGRCRTTAEIIAKATGAEIIFDSNLRERNLGIVQGMFAKDRDTMYPEIYTYEGKPPEGESFQELEARIWTAIRGHKKHHGHKNVVIVTHGGVIRIFLKRLKNWGLEEMFAFFPENAGITEFDILDPCSNCGNDLFEQDPDVFDTWFSSGQWPFATLMTTRPNKKDFKEFYPTDMMETGYDILAIWVVKMVMLGLYRTGEIPFRNVYLHGLVLDKDRQKMSKSKGNVVDPLGVAEIYGSDALRMALVAGNTPGRDIVISEEKIKGYRNFTTKLWNISRFVLMHNPALINADEKPIHTDKKSASISRNQHRSALTGKDKENLAEMKKTKKEVEKHLEHFEFHLAAEKIYHYIWHTFADKVIEEAKPRLREDFIIGRAWLKSERLKEKEVAYQTLETILLESLKMLHPFMPFVTEEIYRKFEPDKILMAERW